MKPKQLTKGANCHQSAPVYCEDNYRTAKRSPASMWQQTSNWNQHCASITLQPLHKSNWCQSSLPLINISETFLQVQEFSLASCGKCCNNAALFKIRPGCLMLLCSVFVAAKKNYLNSIDARWKRPQKVSSVCENTVSRVSLFFVSESLRWAK